MKTLPLRRRPLLGAVLVAGLAGTGFAGESATATGDGAASRFAALAPWLDTLIPADETPSASAVGVDAALLRWARDQPPVIRLLSDGCRWLDEAARQNTGMAFAALPTAAREAVARFAAAAEPKSLPRVFFERSWELARMFYYADPRSWPGLGFDGPPQPVGFPDAARPPRKGRG